MGQSQGHYSDPYTVREVQELIDKLGKVGTNQTGLISLTQF